MAKIIIICGLLIAGIIHLLPLSGVLGAARLQALYGMSFSEPDLLILMRHRAVMFGLLGAFIVFAAFRSEWQWLAIVAGLVSAVAFIFLALQTGGHGEAITRVVVADVVAITALLLAAATKALTS